MNITLDVPHRQWSPQIQNPIANTPARPPIIPLANLTLPAFPVPPTHIASTTWLHHPPENIPTSTRDPPLTCPTPPSNLPEPRPHPTNDLLSTVSPQPLSPGGHVPSLQSSLSDLSPPLGSLLAHSTPLLAHSQHVPNQLFCPYASCTNHKPRPGFIGYSAQGQLNHVDKNHVQHGDLPPVWFLEAVKRWICLHCNIMVPRSWACKKCKAREPTGQTSLPAMTRLLSSLSYKQSLFLI